MQMLHTLIDKAAESCGGLNALASALDVSRQLLWQMRKGQRSITPQTAARLADMLHEDAQLAVNQAVIESEADPVVRSKLREILGKGIAAGVVAMLLTSYNDTSIASTAKENSHVSRVNTLYIVFLEWVRSLRIRRAITH